MPARRTAQIGMKTSAAGFLVFVYTVIERDTLQSTVPSLALTAVSPSQSSRRSVRIWFCWKSKIHFRPRSTISCVHEMCFFVHEIVHTTRIYYPLLYGSIVSYRRAHCKSTLVLTLTLFRNKKRRRVLRTGNALRLFVCLCFVGIDRLFIGFNVIIQSCRNAPINCTHSFNTWFSSTHIYWD